MRVTSSPPISETYDFELVLVSYFSRHQIAGQLAQLPADLPVVIVDNARGADGVEELVRGRPFGRYLDSGGEQGFARASNMGVASSPYPYVVLGSPDCRATVETMRKLVATVRADDGLVTCDALPVDAEGVPEFGAGGWEPTVGRVLVHATGLHLLFPRAGVWARPRVDEECHLDWYSSACSAARVSTFLRLGGWDERYYVYNEDMQFGRTARAAGARQRLRTDLPVSHVGTSGGGSENMLRMRGSSMAHYLKVNNRPLPAAAMWSILVAGSFARVLHARVTRRHARAREFTAYLEGLTGRDRGRA